MCCVLFILFLFKNPNYLTSNRTYIISNFCREIDASNFTLIAYLDVLKDDLSLKVRVINLWKQMSFYNNDEIWSIELIMVDEQVSYKYNYMDLLHIHFQIELLIKHLIYYTFLGEQYTSICPQKIPLWIKKCFKRWDDMLHHIL